MHEELPVTDVCVPAAHDKHVDMAGRCEKRPAGQAVHDDEPSTENWPGRHGRLDEPPVGQKKPGGQRTHCATPGTGV